MPGSYHEGVSTPSELEQIEWGFAADTAGAQVRRHAAIAKALPEMFAGSCWRLGDPVAGDTERQPDDCRVVTFAVSVQDVDVVEQLGDDRLMVEVELPVARFPELTDSIEAPGGRDREVAVAAGFFTGDVLAAGLDVSLEDLAARWSTWWDWQCTLVFFDGRGHAVWGIVMPEPVWATWLQEDRDEHAARTGQAPVGI